MKSKFRKLLSLGLAVVLLLSSAGLGTSVFAAPGDPTDLSNFLKTMTIKDKTTGAMLDLSSDKLIDGRNYEIVLSFHEEVPGKQFGDATMIYNLPSAMTLVSDIAGLPFVIDGNTVACGNSIKNPDDTYKIEVVFVDCASIGLAPCSGDPHDNFIDHLTNIKLNLTLDATFSVESGKTSEPLDFGDNYHAIILERPAKGLDVDKKILTSSTDDIIKYQVEITALGGEADVLENIVFTDKPFLGLAGVTSGTTLAAQLAAYSDFTCSIDGTSVPAFSLTWDSTAEAFVYDFGSAKLPAGKKIIITYDLDVAKFLNLSGKTSLEKDLYAHNTVKVTADDVPDKTDSESKMLTYTSAKATKTASPTVTIQGTNTDTTWTATIDNGALTLNGKTITDVLSSSASKNGPFPVAFPALGNITVHFYDKAGDKLTGPSGITATALNTAFSGAVTVIADTPANGETLTLIVPPATGAGAYGEIYKVELGYKTSVDDLASFAEIWPAQTVVTHTNKITLDDLTATATRTHSSVQNDPPPGIGTAMDDKITKTSSAPKYNSTTNKHEIDYEVNIVVPAGLALDVPDLSTAVAFFFRDDFKVEVGSDTYYNYTPGSGLKDLEVLFTDTSGANVGPSPGSATVKSSYSNSVGNPHWNIFFGIDSTLTYQSRWPRNELTKIKITYTLVLEDIMMATSASATTVKLSDLLKMEDAELINTARLVNALNTEEIDSTKRTTTDVWPIHKYGTLSGDDTLHYTVTLNGGSEKYQLFNAGAAIFTDTFTPKTGFKTAPTYLPATFKVVSDGHTFTLANAADFEISNSGKTFTVDLSKLTVPTGADSDWYTKAKEIVISYDLKINDYIKETKQDVDNSATITATKLGGDFSNNTTVKFTNNPISKSMKQDGTSRYVDVVIEINPKAVQLSTSPSAIIEAVDTMSTNLSIVVDSIKVYEGVGSSISSTPHAMTAANSGAAWTMKGSAVGNIFTFYIPDSTAVTIKYRAEIKDVSGADVTNTITLTGLSLSATDGEVSIAISGAGATASGSKKPVYVDKKDAVSSASLPGAVFELYMALPGNVYYGGGTAPVSLPKITVDGYTFYSLNQSVTTVEDFTKNKFDHQYLTQDSEGVFMLVETTAPGGYVLPKAPDNYTFFALFDNTLYKALVTGAVFTFDIEEINDYITITNDKIPPVVPPGGGPLPDPSPSPSDDPVVTTPGPGNEDDDDDDDVEPTPTTVPPDSTPVPTNPTNTLVPDGDDYIEFDEDGTPLGKWTLNEDDEWEFEEFIPLAAFPPTGDTKISTVSYILMVLSFAGIVVVLLTRFKKIKRHE